MGKFCRTPRIKKLNPAQRKKVEARATALIAEEMTLRELPDPTFLGNSPLSNASSASANALSNAAFQPSG